MKKLFRSRFVYCALVVCFIAAPALAAAVKAGSFESTSGIRDKAASKVSGALELAPAPKKPIEDPVVEELEPYDEQAV